MDKKVETIVRGLLIFLGVFFSFLSFYLVFKIIYGFFTDLNGVVSGSGFEVSFLVPILLFILGFILYKVGRHWDNFFKSLTKTLVSFALFFLTFSILLFPIHNNSEEISGSIQPTIDFIVVSSIDEMIDEALPVVDDEVSVLINLDDKDDDVEEIRVSNMNQQQADMFVDIFDLDFEGRDAQIFSKIIITMIYDEIEKVDSNEHDVPILVSELKSILGSQIDLEALKLIDVSLLESNFKVNEEAYLRLIFSQNIITKVVNPSNLNSDDVNLIWENLGFEGESSYEVKQRIVAGILSSNQDVVENNLVDVEVSIPLSSLSYLIPQEFKDLVKDGIFSDNLSKRAYALNRSRSFCEADLENYDLDVSSDINSNNNNNRGNNNNNDDVEVSPEFDFNEIFCNSISITKYDNLISSLTTTDSSTGELMSQELDFGELNLSEMLSDYETIDEVESKIEDITSVWIKYFYFFIGLMVLALISYYLHFSLFNRELVKPHLPYYISKLNLVDYIPSFILLVVVFFVLKSKFLIDFISNSFSNIFSLNSDFFMNLPIYEVILKINFEFFILSLVYLIISILVYVFFYFILKNELKEVD